MQCKSGCAQAGQNKKRRADARLSWDGVEKLAIGLLLNQNGIDDISAGLFTIFVQCKTDISALDFNILCTGDIREQLSTIQLVLNSLLALIGVAGVQIGVAGNSVSKLVLIQLLDECFIDAGAFLSGIDNTGGEEIVDVAAGEHGSTCNSNSGQTCDLQERTTRQNYGSILLINKNHSTN